MTTEVLALSASSYDAFNTCRRLYYWKHVVRLSPVKQGGSRRFGTLYHAGQEAWWTHADGGDVPWRDRDEPLVHALKALHDAALKYDVDKFERALAEAMMTAYHARYFELDFEQPDNLEGSSVEVDFELPLIDADGRRVPGWVLRGKKDAIKRFMSDRKTRVVEHKHTTNDIDGASDYWTQLRINVQVGLYIDAARRLGATDTNEAMYDVSRKPMLQPYLATPEENREYTKGKGCKYCGGRAGGKLGVSQGTGKVIVRTKVDGDGMPLPNAIDVETDCTACNGTGWAIGDDGKPEAPRLHSKQRVEDESPEDYKARVAEKIISAPNDYFRMGIVARSHDEIAESRQDFVVASAEIYSLLSLMRSRANSVVDVEARRCWPRATSACTNIYGRRCDYLSICAGVVNPFESDLYQIRTRAK